MKVRVIKLVFLGMLVYLPCQSKAWGLLGHRIVGEIASNHLNPKARGAIRSILGDESIAMATNWADFIKSDSNFRYLDPWHYVNFDSGINYESMQGYLKTDTATDAYTKLVFLSRELKKKSLPQQQKLFYLRMLIHIAGDVHQPMHSTAAGDRGGNDIKVQWFSQPANLHSVWDSYFIESQQLSYTEYAQALDHVNAKEIVALQRQPVSSWLYDSYVISDKLRSEIKQPNQRLSYDYNFKHLKTLNEQLLKGGIHLAGLLNEIFGS